MLSLKFKIIWLPICSAADKFGNLAANKLDKRCQHGCHQPHSLKVIDTMIFVATQRRVLSITKTVFAGEREGGAHWVDPRGLGLSLLSSLSSASKWRSWSSGRHMVIGDTSVSLCISCLLHDHLS
ncbi:hypothetical protein HanPI659440_Chr02g0047961 [Helianthus annuus]|nr:hypothetical protein HanPI659440_Chr02g0047961 [Helianthus annuus]